MNITSLYDGLECQGFVRRKDGFWWIRNGCLTSMSDIQGKQVERLINTVFMNQRTPKFAECLGYIKAMLKYRAAAALYRIGDKLDG